MNMAQVGHYTTPGTSMAKKKSSSSWGRRSVLYLTNLVFLVLRWAKPVIGLKPIASITLVTRFDHVQEILSRDDIFRVPYAAKMQKITGEGNFFLGMDDTPIYQRDVANMRQAVRRDDIQTKITPFVNSLCNNILASCRGRLDVVQELTRVVPTRLMGEYFGVPGWDQNEFTDAATAMFHYLFYPVDTAAEQAALDAAGKTRAYLDRTIAERKARRTPQDDILARCLSMQDAGAPGMTDVDIRNNLIGLIIGAIPTTSKSAVNVLDYLLDHPALLALAQRAARADDDRRLVSYVQECLRLNPFAAGVQRICAQDYVVAQGTWRATRIPKGAMVLAATQSAGMDSRKIYAPRVLCLNRPAHHYLHFGYGLHTCFGQHINLAQIPAMVKSVLKLPGLRRASGAAGKMQSVGPFPVSLGLEFDA